MTAAPGTHITYREAVKQGIRDALSSDPRVFLMGEDVGKYGGCFAVSKGLLDEFGEERVRDTPLSESAFVGAGIGAAMAGMRPIVEVMTVNFSLLALDQIVNNAATLCHMSGGQFPVPVVIRMATGAGRQLAAQHSHSLEVWYAHVPGLRVVAPATIDDARGMLRSALECPDPVIIFEPISLYNMEGELTDAAATADLSHARVHREGRDVTLVTYGASLWRCVAAAEELSGNGIEAEIVDLRSLRPLDDATILASVAKTRRVVIVDEGWRSCSLSAEVAMRIVEQGFYDLDAPIARVCSEEVPIPYPKHLEDAALPSQARIVAAVRGMMSHAQ
jgi:pyruvate dehydrogenase E1 component beta subunit/2-oxoisovalerate dehydrogenase E1 component